MKRKHRLTSSADFERVRHMGKSYAHPMVVMITLPNDLNQARIGIAAGRSIGGAVDRNRAKRILRASCQSLISKITSGTDIVLLARRPITKAGSKDLEPIIEQLLNKGKVINHEH